MNHHPHTRSDHLQTYSPRIPLPPRPDRLLTCDPYTERRIRCLLTWGAGACGLVEDRVLDKLAGLFFAREMTLADVQKLASHEVYCAVVRRCDDLIAIRNTGQPARTAD